MISHTFLLRIEHQLQLSTQLTGDDFCFTELIPEPIDFSVTRTDIGARGLRLTPQRLNEFLLALELGAQA